MNDGLPNARLMVVEPSTEVLLLEQTLLEQDGHLMACFHSAERAIIEFAANPDLYDAVVAGVDLDSMGCLAFAEKVRLIRPGIPVILTSTHGAENHSVEGFDVSLVRPEGVREAVGRVLSDGAVLS